MTYCIEIDMKGSLPNWVQNTIAPEQALNAARIRDNLFKIVAGEQLLNKAGGKLTSQVAMLDIAAGNKQYVNAILNKGDQFRYEFMTKENDIGLSIEGVDETEYHTMRRFPPDTLHTGVCTASGGPVR